MRGDAEDLGCAAGFRKGDRGDADGTCTVNYDMAAGLESAARDEHAVIGDADWLDHRASLECGGLAAIPSL